MRSIIGRLILLRLALRDRLRQEDDELGERTEATPASGRNMLDAAGELPIGDGALALDLQDKGASCRELGLCGAFGWFGHAA